MPNDSFTQQALANDQIFRRRVRSTFSAVAWVVQSEDPATPNHANRIKYSNSVIRNLDNELNIILPTFVMRPNVLNFETTAVYDFPTQFNQIVTAAGDADLFSQLSSDWDAMTAAAGFTAP